MIPPLHNSPQTLQSVTAPSTQEKAFSRIPLELGSSILKYVPIEGWHCFSLVSRRAHQLTNQAKLDLFEPLNRANREALYQYLFTEHGKEEIANDPPFEALIKGILKRKIQGPDASKATALLFKGYIDEPNITLRDLHDLRLGSLSVPQTTNSARKERWVPLAKEIEHATAYFFSQSSTWDEDVNLDAILAVEVGDFLRTNLHVFLGPRGIDMLAVILTSCSLEFLAALFRSGFISALVFSEIMDSRFVTSRSSPFSIIITDNPEQFYLSGFYKTSIPSGGLGLFLQPDSPNVSLPLSKIPRHERERHSEYLRGLFGN